MVQIFKNTNYNFIGYRKIAIGISLAIIFAGIISIIFHRGLNYSIDFTGGTLVQLKFEKPVKEDLAKIRTVVNGLGFGSPEIKTVGAIANNEIQITVKKVGEGRIIAEQIREAIAKGVPDNLSEMRRVEQVGPKIGNELKTNAIVATILGLIAILIYVGFRFNLPFGVAAVIPLFHDVAITICVFSFLNIEASLTFIAALLTIVGFSINDTIVIFDRIRENTHGGLRGRKFEDIVNKSVNQTLARTFITSLLTVLMTAALYVLGSEAIKDFALALLVGFIAGVYSTVYIASPILIFWHEKRPIYK